MHSFARRSRMDNGFAIDSRREKGSGSIPGRPRPYSKRNMNSRTAGYEIRYNCKTCARRRATINSIGGLVVEYIVAIDVTRVRFPADALLISSFTLYARRSNSTRFAFYI